jgi:nitrile hydratase
LFHTARAATLELGMQASIPNTVTVLRVMDNTPSVHNVIVCTLCSCYPLGLLGFSPAWYKFRSRVVREHRRVLTDILPFACTK